MISLKKPFLKELKTTTKIFLTTFLVILFFIFTSIGMSIDETSYPPALGYTDMVYDSESEIFILHGGQEQAYNPATSTQKNTWSFDLKNKDYSLMQSNDQLFRSAMAMAYDSESDRTILFGGGSIGSNWSDPVAETWSYDYNSNVWENITPEISPPGRGGHQMVYDKESDKIIMFGGVHYIFSSTGSTSSSIIYGDIWSYDYNTNTWTNLTTNETPKGRLYPSMAYDSESDRTILYGGCESVAIGVTCSNFPVNNTWSYDLNNNQWTIMNPKVEPKPRMYPEMAYDSNSDVIVLFGGYPIGYETWKYDYNSNNWEKIISEISPKGRDRFSMSYSEKLDLIFIYGGQVQRLNLAEMINDSWTFDVDTSTWEKVTFELKSVSQGVPATEIYYFISFLMAIVIIRKKIRKY